MTPLFETRDLTARYGSLEALRSVNLRIEAGEVVALLGANGAGKTTTLMSIAGLLRSRNGQLLLDGEETSGWAAETMVERGVSLVPEGRRIFTALTVAENLTLGSAVRRRQDRAESDRNREELLELFPVLRRRYRALGGALSGGEQQQLAMARSLMSRPRLLLLDEPSLGLAPKLVLGIFELIAQLRRDRGMAILVVEQNVHRALAIADRGYVLRSGQLEMHGTPEELRTAGLEGAYLGGKTAADQPPAEGRD